MLIIISLSHISPMSQLPQVPVSKIKQNLILLILHSGICGLIWYCFWLWLVFEKPSKHPCISVQEIRYIEDSLGQGGIQQAMPTFSSTPWRKFFTSMPVHAIIVANFCRSWNFYLLVLFQARFMHESFGMPLVEVQS